ncbi:MAG: hypothetical protein H7279_06930 [Microbacteriaceae bacterium]|nr:hypothetical protein [Microbacteriaceae bacterium]
MFGSKALNRVITDFDIGIPENWHLVDLADSTAAEWARATSSALATTDTSRIALSERLKAVFESLAGLGQPGLSAAVWVRAPDSGVVDAILGIRMAQLDDGMDSAAYLAGLEEDEGRAQPGERYQVVQTWTTPIDAGLAVGAYNRISHLELGGDRVDVEERTVIAVFPPKSSQVIECVFTTAVPGTYDDIILETMAHVATMRIETAKA